MIKTMKQREMKFRVYESSHWKTMLYGSLGKSIFDFEFADSNERRVWLADEWGFPVWNVMQFTGLLDKNGKEIFDGDIVRLSDGSDVSHHKIFWDIKAARWWDLRLEDGDSMSGYQDHCIDWVIEGTICGNIYENPELLK